MATAVPAAAVPEEGAVGHGGRTHVTVVALHAFEDRARDRRPIRKVAAIIVCERTRSDWRSNTFLTVRTRKDSQRGFGQPKLAVAHSHSWKLPPPTGI